MNIEEKKHRFDWFYTEGRDIRVHGNGFIQLDMGEARAHFWGDGRIPRQLRPSPIHDHRFAFSSSVLMGRLINVRYSTRTARANDDATFDRYMPIPRGGEDTELQKVSTAPLALVVDDVNIVAAGGGYAMRPWELHETVAAVPTVTMMHKSADAWAIGPGDMPDFTAVPQHPSVLVPAGMKPDNAFDRYAYKAEFLWQIVHDIIMAEE